MRRKKNSLKKLKFASEEAEEILSTIPILWIEEELYRDEIAYAKKLVRDETDAPLIALHKITGYPILTGDKDILETKQTTALTPSKAIEYLIENGFISKRELKEIKNMM